MKNRIAFLWCTLALLSSTFLGAKKKSTVVTIETIESAKHSPAKVEALVALCTQTKNYLEKGNFNDANWSFLHTFRGVGHVLARLDEKVAKEKTPFQAQKFQFRTYLQKLEIILSNVHQLFLATPDFKIDSTEVGDDAIEAAFVGDPLFSPSGNSKLLSSILDDLRASFLSPGVHKTIVRYKGVAGKIDSALKVIHTQGLKLSRQVPGIISHELFTRLIKIRAALEGIAKVKIQKPPVRRLGPEQRFTPSAQTVK